MKNSKNTGEERENSGEERKYLDSQSLEAALPVLLNPTIRLKIDKQPSTPKLRAYKVRGQKQNPLKALCKNMRTGTTKSAMTGNKQILALRMLNSEAFRPQAQPTGQSNQREGYIFHCGLKLSVT